MPTKAKQQIEIREIKPAEADEMLGRNFRNNRSINPTRVKTYADEMKAGNWTFTGEAIKFGQDDMLIDGQHRLSAIVLAGVPIQMLIVTGLEKSAVTNLDTTMPRSLKNVLEFLSYENAGGLALALSSAWVYEAYMEDKLLDNKGSVVASVGRRRDRKKKPYQRHSNNRFTRTAALELLDRRPTLIDSVATMKSHIHARKSQPIRPSWGTVSLIHNIAATVDVGASVIEYVESVRSGEGFATDTTWQVNRILERAAGVKKEDQMLPYTKDALWFRGYEGFMKGNEEKVRTPTLRTYPIIPGDVEWYADGRG